MLTHDQGRYCELCGAWRGSLGLEPTPDFYVQHIVEVFREVRRVLRKDGTLWLNLGDCYAANRSYQVRDSMRVDVGNYMSANVPDGLKPKDLVGIPWRVAFALQEDGWWLRSDIIWSKPNPMPESVTDRPTKAHEYLFLMAKSERYFYDADAIREPFNFPERIYSPDTTNHKTAQLREQGNRSTAALHDGRVQYGDPLLGRNRRTVWEIGTQAYEGAHFATFPEALVLPCVLAGTSEKGCCPKCGGPWERIVYRESPPMEVFTRTRVTDDEVNDMIYTPRKDGMRVGAGQRYQNWRNEHPPTTVDWEPTCACGVEETVPATVLDPFVGSGTVLLVAAKNGRNSVGIELQEDYLSLIESRLRPLESDLIYPVTIE